MDADTKDFVQGCISCLLSDSGMKVPRILGNKIHANRVAEFLHFNFFYIGESKYGYEYILILKGDFSGYILLRSYKKADAEFTVEVLMDYFTTFVPVCIGSLTRAPI